MEDPDLFGPLIKDQETFRNWKTFLKALFGLPMDLRELEALKKFTGRDRPPSGQVKESYCIAGRRSGKSLLPKPARS